MTVKPYLSNNEIEIRFRLKKTVHIKSHSNLNKKKLESNLNLQTPIVSTATLFPSPMSMYRSIGLGLF